MSTAAPRPLALTADEALLDDLIRLAAAVGLVFDVAHDVGVARRAWAHAALVIVGADRAHELARVALPRRRDVYVVARESADPTAWQLAVTLAAEDVLVLPDAETQLVDRLADAAEGVSREAMTIGVIGGRGGAGASTLAVALSMTAVAQGWVTLLVDGDPLSGGSDLLLGAEDTPGMRWPDLVDARGRLGPTALRDAVPRVEDLYVLSWDRGEELQVSAEVMRAVLGAAQRAHDLVVVDLPRRIDDAATEALPRCTPVLLVVPAQVRAVAAAGRVATAVAPFASDTRLVVRGPAPARLDARVIAEALRLPLAGELAPEPGIDRMLEEGGVPGRRGTGPLASLCRTIVGDLAVPSAA